MFEENNLGTVLQQLEVYMYHNHTTSIVGKQAKTHPNRQTFKRKSLCKHHYKKSRLSHTTCAELSIVVGISTYLKFEPLGFLSDALHH